MLTEFQIEGVWKGKVVYLALTLLIVPISRAQMIRGDALKQDTAKLNLCISRARHGNSMTIGDQDLVPFEIERGLSGTG